MEKLKMHSVDLTQANIDRIAELLPNVVTESLDTNGHPVRAIDFDTLRQALSDHIVEGPQERYRLDWPGKRAAAFAANAPIAKTLRPVREESVRQPRRIEFPCSNAGRSAPRRSGLLPRRCPAVRLRRS